MKLSNADELEEYRQALGRILDDHARAVLEARHDNPYAVKWNKGEYVLRLEKKLTKKYAEKALHQALIAKIKPKKIKNSFDINSRSWGYANGYNQALAEMEQVIDNFFGVKS